LARASLTKMASQRRSMAHPTALREKRSSTTQQYTLPSPVGCSVMSVSQSSLGAEAVNSRWTRSSQVRAFFRFLKPFFGPGSPLRPSSRMIRLTSLVLTIRPCSISNAALTRKMP